MTQPHHFRPDGAYKRAKHWFLGKKFWKQVILTLLALFLFVSGVTFLWVASLRLPDLDSFKDRVLSSSTKVYDRTGEILLYDLNQNVRQETVPFEKISQHIKDATIAIEDEQFYKHHGIEFASIVRAIWVNAKTMSFSQGGSTLTQQVIKNNLLTTDKKISRKIKEWVLALKLERTMPKDDILNLYLNSTPYGGPIYGVEQAALSYFGKRASDLSVTESAYLAAMGKAPSYYSPYGSHPDKLEARKNLVLQKMKDNGFITQSEYDASMKEKVVFKAPENRNIKAPHFVMYVKQYLEEKYGEETVKSGGLKVVTTLDYELQSKGEEIVKRFALSNEKNFSAENAALSAVDPATGQILVMVGSRDYFDPDIEGNFNVTTAHRQPGSSFKPFAYATAFNKGYTPDTVLFDLPTQFSTACDASGTPLPGRNPDDCYMPENYDHQYLGPMSLRNALAQSRNVPAIKVLYLAGMGDTIATAKSLGITSLTDPARYGLTLVLGGGEVSPLEMTGAYSVFANNGVRNALTPILKVTDKKGNTLEEWKSDPKQVLPEQTALLVNSVLSDPNARLPLNGPGSATDFPAGTEVALKTGTTNDYHDVWILGYTPSFAAGAWAGNNDNRPMIKKTSGMIIAPLWRAFMDEALKKYPSVPFKRPEPIDASLRPILRGVWQGGQTYVVDKTSGNIATDQTPPELREERAVPDVHSILYWVNKNDPKGNPPANPNDDPQFQLWEKPIRDWAMAQGSVLGAYVTTNWQPTVPSPTPSATPLPTTVPTQVDQNHTPDAAPRITFQKPINGGTYLIANKMVVSIAATGKFPITNAEYYVNGALVGTAQGDNPQFSFVPGEIPGIQSSNTLRVVVYDNVRNRAESSVTFNLR